MSSPRLFICLVGGRGGAKRSANREVGKGSGAWAGGGATTLPPRRVGAGLAAAAGTGAKAGAESVAAGLDLVVLDAINGELFCVRGGVGLAAVLVTLAGVFAGVLAAADFLAVGAFAFTADLTGALEGAFLATILLGTGFAAGFFAGGLAGDLTAFLATVFGALLPKLLPALLPTVAAGFFVFVFFAGVLLTKVSSQR